MFASKHIEEIRDLCRYPITHLSFLSCRSVHHFSKVVNVYSRDARHACHLEALFVASIELPISCAQADDL
jgi:hypothetical protein